MTDQLEFTMPAPTRARFPQEPIVREADVEGVYRWTLRRAWGAGPCILWCGLNPSTADGKVDDPTMRREIGFSYRWGFGSLVKVNVFPLVSSRPLILRSWTRAARIRPVGPGSNFIPWPIDRSELAAWRHNVQVVGDQIAACQKHVAAWGAGTAIFKDHMAEFLGGVGIRLADSQDGQDVVETPTTWHCLGITADGSPIHTLARGRSRVPDDAELKVWRGA